MTVAEAIASILAGEETLQTIAGWVAAAISAATTISTW